MKTLLIFLLFLLPIGVFSQIKTATDSSLVYCLINRSYSDLVVFTEDTNYVKLNSQEYITTPQKNDVSLAVIHFFSSVELETYYIITLNRNADTILDFNITKFSKNTPIVIAREQVDTSNYFSEDIDTEHARAYGSHCSIAGIDPPYRQQLNTILSKGDYKILDEWLVSSYPEIQVYAVEGLYLSKNKGYKLTSKQQALISALKKDNSRLHTCSGCIYTQEKVGAVLEKFTF